MLIQINQYTEKILAEVKAKYPKASKITESKVNRILVIFHYCLYKAIIHQRKIKSLKRIEVQKTKIGNIILSADHQKRQNTNRVNSGLIIKIQKLSKRKIIKQTNQSNKPVL